MSKLIGPVRLVEYKDPDRHIYFFGDHHTIEPSCEEEEGKETEIQDFLETILSENKSKTIDFFLEIPSLEDQAEYLNTTYIDKIVDKFIDCFKVDKKNCSVKYPNLRAHYVDRRQEAVFANISCLTRLILDTKRAIYSSFKDTGEILSEAEKERIISRSDEIETNIKKLQFRKMLFHIYLKKFLSTCKITIDDIFNIFKVPTQLLTRMKFYKQLENIQDKKTSEFIKAYFENKLSSFKDKDKIIIFLSKFLNQPYSKSKDSKGTSKVYNGLTYQEILENLHEILAYNAYYMDAYTIARLFRDYDKPKTGREKGEKAKYIMIYAGDAHIDNYLEFFQEYNSVFGVKSKTTEQISDFREVDYQCINLSEFELPFFKN